jgi:hypothetical protein
MPAALALHDLMDRQHVEIFVGKDDARAFRHIIDGVVPGNVANARQGLSLLLPQYRVDLDQIHADRLIERRHDPQRAQRVRHHGAAAGSELDQPKRRGRTDHLPNRGSPQAEQLAEHLADLGGGDEVALAAERIARDIVAVLGMHQAQLHIAPHRHRSGRFDEPLDLRLQRRNFGHSLP